MAESLRVVQYASAYGTEILDARLPTEEERAKYAEWFRPRLLYAVGDAITLPRVGLLDVHQVLGDRKATHAFPGCSNMAWVITPDEEQALLRIEAERVAEEERTAQATHTAESERREAILAEAQQTGDPKPMGTWMTDCDGSTGDCSFDTMTLFIRPDGSTYTERRHCH